MEQLSLEPGIQPLFLTFFFYQSVFVYDSLPEVHNQLQSLNTNLEKVNDRNVPVRAGTLVCAQPQLLLLLSAFPQ